LDAVIQCLQPAQPGRGLAINESAPDMKASLFPTLLATLLLGGPVSAQPGSPDKMVGGELFPSGHTPVAIKDGTYPRDYYPNTELLGDDEMRVTALGTGMPNVITGAQKASAAYVELGNGDKYLFDVGSVSMKNLSKLRPDWSKVDKLFASHLDSDHVGGFADLYIGTLAAG
jgi:hypothetical protein